MLCVCKITQLIDQYSNAGVPPLHYALLIIATEITYEASYLVSNWGEDDGVCAWEVSWGRVLEAQEHHRFIF